MADFTRTLISSKPQGYVPPPFPSLYWPFPVDGVQTRYLYDAHDMWKFTLYWTITMILGVHIITSVYAVLNQMKNWKVIWLAPVLYIIIGGIEALIAGNVTGALLGGVYTAGTFRMSTWIPFTWGCINALVLIIASFAIQGGL